MFDLLDLLRSPMKFVRGLGRLERRILGKGEAGTDFSSGDMAG